MKHRGLALTLLAALVVAASGSSGKYRLIDRWQNPDDHVVFKKFIIVGISDVKEARHQFENNFVSQLRGRDIGATASYTIVPVLTGIDEAEREKILETIEEEKIDGAITVRAVPLKDQTEAEWIEAWKARLTSDTTLRQLIEATLPLSDEKSKRYGVELTVWDTATGKRMWAGRTDPLSRGDLNRGVPEFVRGVIGALVMVDLV